MHKYQRFTAVQDVDNFTSCNHVGSLDYKHIIVISLFKYHSSCCIAIEALALLPFLIILTEMHCYRHTVQIMSRNNMFVLNENKCSSSKKSDFCSIRTYHAHHVILSEKCVKFLMSRHLIYYSVKSLS